MNSEWRKETPITQSYGKKHDVGLLYTWEMEVSMTDYIKLIMQDAPEDMAGIVATPTGNRLFKVSKTSPSVPAGDKKDNFVLIVIQLLYLSQRT